MIESARRVAMPKVGKVHFPYTAAGRKAAAMAAKKTGRPMMNKGKAGGKAK